VAAEREIELPRIRIARNVYAQGSTFFHVEHAGKPLLRATSMYLGDSVDGMDIQNFQIEGELFIATTKVHFPAGLTAEQLRCNRAVYLFDVQSEGRISFHGANIGQEFFADRVIVERNALAVLGNVALDLDLFPGALLGTQRGLDRALRQPEPVYLERQPPMVSSEVWARPRRSITMRTSTTNNIASETGGRIVNGCRDFRTRTLVTAGRGTAMIKIGLKGLAKFMTSSPATQRKVLRDYKYTTNTRARKARHKQPITARLVPRGTNKPFRQLSREIHFKINLNQQSVRSAR
jgi:hypothetical protein